MICIKDTDLQLSTLGLGSTGAGLKWDGKNAYDLLEHFFDIGGNFFDTAHIYSDWVPGEFARSERVIGDWLHYRGRRHDVIIATKGGHPYLDSMHISRLSKEEMRTDIEDSLKKLQTDYIDIYFYHRDDTCRPVEELIETMEAFRREGKLRYYACSNWTTSRMKEADAYCANKGYRGFVANQALYNIGVKHMGSMTDPTMVACDMEMLDYHSTSTNLLIPYAALCGGFFHRLKQGEIPANDAHGYNTPKNMVIAKELDVLCQKNGYDLAQAMLGFFKVHDFDILPLFGTSSIANMNQVTKYMTTKYKKEDYKFI